MSRVSNRSGMLLTCSGALALVGGVGSAAPLCGAEPIQMVLSASAHAPTSAKSAIPGAIPGGPGTQTDPRFNNLNARSYHSPTGSLWMVGASTNLPSSGNVLIMGSGLSVVGGALAARETITTTVGGDPLNVNLLQAIPRINDAGQWAVASGSSAGPGKIMRFDGVNLVTLFSSGDALPGGAGPSGGTFGGANILPDGSVSFISTVNAAGSTSGGPFSAFTTAGAGSMLINAGTDVPLDQGAGATAAWLTVNSLSNFSQNLLGTSWCALGRVGTNTGVDTCVVVDNHVKIQEGFVIPGSGFVSLVSTISEAAMEPNGDWYARGSNADSQAWIVRNGVVVAAAGQSITPGSTEHWKTGSNFIMVQGNPRGNYVITGTTDNTDTTRNQVMVLNGMRVVARTSDPIDLDADGLFSGSLFLFSPQDKGTYAADGYYYFSSRLKSVQTAATSTLGTNASFMRVLACPTDYNGSGSVTVADIFDFLNGWFAGAAAADFNGGGLGVNDIFDFLNAWFTGC